MRRRNGRPCSLGPRRRWPPAGLRGRNGFVGPRLELSDELRIARAPARPRAAGRRDRGGGPPARRGLRAVGHTPEPRRASASHPVRDLRSPGPSSAVLWSSNRLDDIRAGARRPAHPTSRGLTISCRTTSTRYAIGTAANSPRARLHGVRVRAGRASARWAAAPPATSRTPRPPARRARTPRGSQEPQVAAREVGAAGRARCRRRGTARPARARRVRLLTTARNTGRGARRNWRHRTSKKPRRAGRHGAAEAAGTGTGGVDRGAAPSGEGLVIAPQDGERPARRDRRPACGWPGAPPLRRTAPAPPPCSRSRPRSGRRRWAAGPG